VYSSSLVEAWHLFVTSVLSWKRLAGLAVLISCSVLQAQTFTPATNYPVGSSPFGLAPGDFNGDNKPDLVVADQADNTISILLNNGNGTFGPANILLAGSSPQFILTGDFDNDGHADIVVANTNSNTVGLFRGNGDGTFRPMLSIPVGLNPLALAVADFNKDGRLDLAVVDFGANALAILLGNGDGTFQAPAAYATDLQPVSLVVGDFNGDGKPDVAVSTSVAAIDVFLNNGSGQFGAPVVSAFTSGGGAITAGDLNQDGKLDLVVANQGVGGFNVLAGVGDGTFSFAGQFFAFTGMFANSVLLSDVNGDGQLDLIAADPVTGINVFLGNGPGNFSVPLRFSADVRPWFALTADFNGDGQPDIAAVNVSSSDVSVLTNVFPVIAPVFMLSPANVDFGDQVVGFDSAPQTVTVSNIGLVPAREITGVITDMTDIAATDFRQTASTCPPSLPPGGSCDVSVVFRPSAVGARVGVLAVTAKFSGQASVGLFGTGIAPTLQVSHISVDFGNQLVGTVHLAPDIILTNIGSVSTTVQLTIGAPFTEVDNCRVLLPNSSCKITIKYGPQVVGTDSTELLIVGSNATAKQVVNVKGHGVASNQAAALPIVFLHGWCGDYQDWFPITTALSSALPSLYSDQISPDTIHYDGTSVLATSTDAKTRMFLVRFFDTRVTTPISQRLDPANVNEIPAFAKADQLAHIIAAVKARTGASKVIVVGHSFGGLVARSYLEQLATPAFDAEGNPIYPSGPDAYGEDVAALITLDTPHGGAALASETLDFSRGPCFIKNSVNKREMIPSESIIRTLNYDVTASVGGRTAQRLPTDVPITSLVSFYSLNVPIAPSIPIHTDGVLGRDEQNLRLALPKPLVTPDIKADTNALDPSASLDTIAACFSPDKADIPILHLLKCLGSESQIIDSLAIPISSAQRLSVAAQ
jgi:pimeloyl-ACP methyl ester carboxylesterase